MTEEEIIKLRQLKSRFDFLGWLPKEDLEWLFLKIMEEIDNHK